MNDIESSWQKRLLEAEKEMQVEFRKNIEIVYRIAKTSVK